MFKVVGTLKRDAIREWTSKSGQSGTSREVYIQPDDGLYPIKVNINDQDLDIGEVGEPVNLDVEIFPYKIVDGKRKRAFVDIYIPKQK